MAIIKCKMCGGDLELIPDSTVCECEYCGTKQTVPVADNEKKLSLFARANKLRVACDFDKAYGVFESIVVEFPDEAEAYWGLVLCKYGIEYVDDPGTGKKIPTCHRSSFDSVLSDANLDLTLENADAAARKVYREEAKAIEELRKRIIEVSSKEEPYDIFICYKETALDGQRSVDSVLAQDIYKELTREGYRVFFSRITLEDKLGVEYEPYIFAALNSAKVMLAVGTDYEHFNAVWVKNEWSRFLKLMEQDHTKHLIPCYKGIDAYDMPPEFKRLQAQDLGKVGAVQDILHGIEKLIDKKKQEPVQKVATDPTAILLSSAETYIQLGDYAVAERKYKEINDKYPQICQGWWGRVICASKGLVDSGVDLQALNKWMLNAKKTAKGNEFANMEKQYLEYLKIASTRATANEESELQRSVERKQQRLEQLQSDLFLLQNDENNRKNQLTQDLQDYQQLYHQGKTQASKGKRQTTKGTIKIIFGICLIAIGVIGLLDSGFTFWNCVIAGALGMWGWATINGGRDKKKEGNNMITQGQEYMTSATNGQHNAAEEDVRRTQQYNESVERTQKEINGLTNNIHNCHAYLQLDFEDRKERCFTQSCQAIGVSRDYDPQIQKMYEAAK